MAEITVVVPEVLETLRRIALKNIKKPGASQDIRAYRGPRVPFVLTCEEWIALDQYITLFVNPSEITVTQGLRAADQKTKTGTIRHTWPDKRRKTFFDEPVVAFQFQSGNVMPGSHDDPNKPAREPRPGWRDFNNFMELISTNPLLDNGRPNFLHAHINTRIFPSMVLTGFIKPEGVSVTDSIDDGNNIKWTAAMEVRVTNPPMNSSRQLEQAFKDMAIKIGLASSANEAEARSANEVATAPNTTII